jgi:cytochrome c-type biogenesis protein CcmH
MALFPEPGVNCPVKQLPGISFRGLESGVGRELIWIMKWFFKLGILALFLLVPMVTTGAQQAPRLDEPVQPHPEGDAAIARLKSPFCPGMMLEVCPSPQAKLLRDSIQALAWNGAPADSLVEWMLANHGEEYRAVPLVAGTGLWAWIMPPLALLGGLIVVAMALHHFRTRKEGQEEKAVQISSEDESVLEEALKELKDSEEVPF